MDELLARLRAEHRVSTFAVAGGSGWACSCGREVYPGYGFPSDRVAFARAERHLRAELRKLSATREVGGHDV